MQVPRWRRFHWCCAALHSSTNNLHVLLGSYWFDNLGFFLRENLPLCASYLPLGVPNGRVHLRASSNFFWRRCRGDQDTLQGESPHPISLLCFCLALLYFIYCLVCFILKHTKKIVTLLSVLFTCSILKTQKKLVTC